LGSYFGVPLGIHWTTLLSLSILALFSPFSFFILFGTFFFVIFHEYGHVLAGKVFGVPTKDVTLYPLGGVASMQLSLCNSSKKEFFIAIAGPLVNIFFALLFFPLIEIYFFLVCFVINLSLALFNLLPIFPMDGGRIFRSFIRLFIKNLNLATRIAVSFGQFLCFIFIFLSVFYGEYILAAIFIFLIFLGNVETHVIKLISSLPDIKKQAAEILGKPELINASNSKLIDALDQVASQSAEYTWLELEHKLPDLKMLEENGLI